MYIPQPSNICTINTNHTNISRHHNIPTAIVIKQLSSQSNPGKQTKTASRATYKPRYPKVPAQHALVTHTRRTYIGQQRRHPHNNQPQ